MASADELEAEGAWGAAFDARRAALATHPGDRDALLSIAFTSWYVMAEWGCISTRGLNDKECLRALREASAELAARHAGEASVLFVLGYMMSLFSWLFDPDTNAVEQRATEMLRAAHELCPDDDVYALAYLSNVGELGDEYKVACARARPTLAARFPGIGAMASYFRQVLDRPIAEPSP
jgi:hypothetical protein